MLALSGCRTGVLAVMLGVFGTGGLAIALRANHRARNWRALLAGVGACVCVGVVVFQSGRESTDRVLAFILKGAKTTEASAGLMLAQSVEASRGAQIQKSIDNLSARPSIRVGFGMSSVDGVDTTARDPIFGLPISAPIEPGFLPIAVPAQVGLLGSAPLIWLLSVLTGMVVSRAPLPAVVLFGGALSVNLGEMVFFSPGGLGVQMWIWIGVTCSALESDSQRSVYRQKPPRDWHRGPWRVRCS